jgi:hypothetical protein
VVLSLVLAALLTWPAVLRPTEVLVGHPGNDAWNHVWGYWWVAEELLAGRWPGHTVLLSHPTGGSLYFIDTTQAVLTLPLQLIGGPALAYNAAVIGGLALAGLGAWLLTRRLTGDAVTAAFALVVFESSPHLLGQAYNGISETVCAGWLPLTLWALTKVFDRPTPLRALGLGMLGGITMLTSWYYGLFAALGGLALVAWQAATQAYAVDWRRTLPALGASAAVALVIISPLLGLFRGSLEAEDALVTRDPEFVRASLMNHNITDLVAIFKPSKVPSPDLLELYGEQLIIVTYVGWVALLLAGAAVVMTRRRREWSPWVVLGLVFLLFALGPYLNVGGEYVELGGRRIPLPFLALFELFPVFDRISHPFRFVLGFTLTIAVVASHGLRHLLRRLDTPRRLAAVGGLSLVVLAEVALGSPARLPIPTSDAHIPQAYVDMVEDDVPGAVLDLPMTVPNLERAVYTWYQSAHGRPVPWGLNDPMPRALLDNRLTAALIRLEAVRAHTLAPHLPELDLVVAGRLLARDGYRYVVVHEDLYPDFKRANVEAVLTGVFGEPRAYPDDGIKVWTLPVIES